MIVNHLARLLDGRQMSLSELQRRTGLAYSSLHKMHRGAARRYDAETLDAICSALGIGVGDLLEHVAA